MSVVVYILTSSNFRGELDFPYHRCENPNSASPPPFQADCLSLKGRVMVFLHFGNSFTVKEV